MRKYWLLLFLTVLSLSTQAQLLGKFDIGVRAGGTANIVAFNPQYQTNRAYDNSFAQILGFEVGVPMAYHFQDWVALSWEVNLQQRTNRYVNYYADGPTDRYFLSEQQRNLFVDVPVMAQFSFGGEKVRGFFDAGLYAGAWVYGTQVGRVSSSPTYAGATEISYTDYRHPREWNRYDSRFDLGVMLGIGVRWLNDKPVAMSLEYRFNYGFLSRQKQFSAVGYNIYDTPMSICLGLHFNTAKTAWVVPE